MNPSDPASEHLRVIRSLMERATIYRAISGPAALFGGTLSLLVGCLQLAQEKPVSNAAFVGAWMTVLALVTIVNFSLLFGGAKKRGEPFVSAGMKHALAAIAPPLLAGFVLSLVISGESRVSHGDYSVEISAAAPIALIWILCYGLALLACGSFAPRSMRILGLTFFLFGVGLLLFGRATEAEKFHLGVKAMIGTFGVLHLVYGCYVTLSSRKAGAQPFPP